MRSVLGRNRVTLALLGALSLPACGDRSNVDHVREISDQVGEVRIKLEDIVRHVLPPGRIVSETLRQAGGRADISERISTTLAALDFAKQRLLAAQQTVNDGQSPSEKK